MKNKKVLITGVTGMVGSHLTDLLLKKTNWKIYGMCRWRSPLNNLQHLLDLANKKNVWNLFMEIYVMQIPSIKSLKILSLITYII